MNTNFQALLVLLDDPDQSVFDTVKEEFYKQGIAIIPDLEQAWESTFDEFARERIEEIIHDLQFRELKNDLQNWKSNNQEDLLQGAWLIARYQYPDLPYEDINTKIEQIKYDIWLELADNLTALERVKVINHIFFEIHKFSGNVKNYFSPVNSFLNQVLEMKKGNPISLAIIYSTLAKRLEIPVYGVNLPKNFILAYMDEQLENHHLPIEEKDVLFYINPFNRGLVFGKREIDLYLDQQKLEQQVEFYKPCSNLAIIRRIVQNLTYSYEQLGFSDKVNDMKELMDLLDES